MRGGCEPVAEGYQMCLEGSQRLAEGEGLVLAESIHGGLTLNPKMYQ